MADGVEQVEIDAPRVIELLQELVRRYPALEDRLSEMAVAVDGDIYNDADYVRLHANSEVHLVPRIAGGSPPRPDWIRPATRLGPQATRTVSRAAKSRPAEGLHRRSKTRARR